MQLDKDKFLLEYNEYKKIILFDDDILMLKAIADEVRRFPTIKTTGELVDLESNLSALSFQLAGLVARLSGQIEIERSGVQNRQSVIFQNRREGKKATEIVGLSDAIKAELAVEHREIKLAEAIHDEYSKKLGTLPNIFLAITHRLRKLEKNL